MPISVVAKLAISAAMMAANMALTMTQRIAGPRLESLDVTIADYGTPIPRFWGRRRFDAVPIIWAERLREVKSTEKTKGGKYDEYRYYGTFAVLLCDHEIESVSRIWMDKHLVYDATSTGPLASYFGVMPDGTRSPVKIQRGRNMRIYTGTETQEADPRMESWCEDRYGANSCPAYRGSAYIVFQDLPLEKFGNRLPQISVEAINVSTDSFPYETKTDSTHMSYFKFSPDFSRFVTGNGPTEIWDTATRTRLFSVTMEGAYPSIDENGSIWTTGDLLGSTLFKNSPDGHTVTAEFALPTDVFSDWVFTLGEGVYLRPYTGGQAHFIYLGGLAVEKVDISFNPTAYFQDVDGPAWAVGATSGSLHFFSLTDGSFTVSSPGTATTGFAMDNGEGQFLCRHSNNLVLIDKATRAVVDTAAVSADLSDTFKTFRNIAPGSASIWFQTAAGQATEYSTTTLEALRTVTLSNWRAQDVDELLYDPISHALITTPQITNELDWRYLDRVSSPGVTLESVVEDVAGWSGVDSVDASALTQLVYGYSVTQGTGKDILAPLLDIHDSDVRPHDFAVQFLRRNSSTGGTLDTEDFVRSGDGPRYTVSIQQDTDIPRRVTLNFADIDKDQQTNTVIAQRPLDSVDSVRELTIDMTTYARSPGEAQQLADRFFRRMWNARETISLSLTAQEMALEPGDVRTLDLDGITRDAKLQKLALSGGALKTEWERHFPGLHTLGTGTGAEMEGRDDDGIYVASPTKGFVFDIPFIEDRDSTDNPLLYYGAGAYGSGDWPGAVFAEQVGDTYTQWNAVESSNKAAWGYVFFAALGDANPNLWDRGNGVYVNLISGSLTNCSEADIDADPTLNLAYIGGEIVNFTTTTLQGDGSYLISGFKRGRRGTEWACGTHAIGDEFAVLSTFKSEELGLSDIASAFTFRAATLGRLITSGPAIDVTLAANNLKPYAPARLKTYYDGTDLQCTIFRRTRLGGAWMGGTTIPLSEASQEYEVEVYNGAVLKRTITVTGAATFTYTAAMAATDGISLPTRPTFKVFQMSDAVGRGFELAA